jgi:polyhydroxyalkanoate synthesis regulator phasin
MEKDIWQKAMMATLGLAEKTKEKTSEIIEKLVQQGKLTSEEGQHIIGEVKEVTLKGSEEAKEKFQHGLASAKDKLTFAHESDLEKLTSRVSQLEKKIKALEVTLLGLNCGGAMKSPAKQTKQSKAKHAARRAKKKSS